MKIRWFFRFYTISPKFFFVFKKFSAALELTIGVFYLRNAIIYFEFFYFQNNSSNKKQIKTPKLVVLEKHNAARNER